MPLDINTAAARLARDMGQAETTIADALVAVSSLLHSATLAGRDISDAPALQTQSALLHLNKLMTSLVDARSEALRVHSQLLDIGREMGATESPYCPSRNEIEPEQRHAA
jgi:hypothetical protein